MENSLTPEDQEVFEILVDEFDLSDVEAELLESFLASLEGYDSTLRYPLDRPVYGFNQWHLQWEDDLFFVRYCPFAQIDPACDAREERINARLRGTPWVEDDTEELLGVTSSNGEHLPLVQVTLNADVEQRPNRYGHYRAYLCGETVIFFAEQLRALTGGEFPPKDPPDEDVTVTLKRSEVEWLRERADNDDTHIGRRLRESLEEG